MPKSRLVKRLEIGKDIARHIAQGIARQVTPYIGEKIEEYIGRQEGIGELATDEH